MRIVMCFTVSPSSPRKTKDAGRVFRRYSFPFSTTGAHDNRDLAVSVECLYTPAPITMMPSIAVFEIVAWTFLAFWLWLAFTAVLRRGPLSHRNAVAIAALLGWVTAGLLMQWALPDDSLERWFARALFSALR
jgi:hypothetical protein